MISAPAIALYLGESYASLGAFDLSGKELFEKSIFLPQVSLKNLLTQAQKKMAETYPDIKNVQFFIVTKYLDRLKNFRLGGSVAQVVLAGFENSYSLVNTKALSLAAASLTISVDPENLNELYLTDELKRIKKINPDTNKVVVQLSEKNFSSAQCELIHNFFSKSEFNIFTCTQPENLAEVRKALLNAGTEGTKEEVISEIKEIFGEEVTISFFCDYDFKTKFENCELFGSCNSFLATLAKAENSDSIAYFDHETFRLIKTQSHPQWQSPWGIIPVTNYESHEIQPHPFSEIRLDTLSMLSISQLPTQHEPGPVCAGRGIKPLVIDLFSDEMSLISIVNSLFPQFNSESQKQKLENHLSILEKGQSNNLLKTNRNEIKKQITDRIKNELKTISQKQKLKITGPLAPVFGFKNIQFSWPKEIIKKALTGFL